MSGRGNEARGGSNGGNSGRSPNGGRGGRGRGDNNNYRYNSNNRQSNQNTYDNPVGGTMKNHIFNHGSNTSAYKFKESIAAIARYIELTGDMGAMEVADALRNNVNPKVKRPSRPTKKIPNPDKPNEDIDNDDYEEERIIWEAELKKIPGIEDAIERQLRAAYAHVYVACKTHLSRQS